MPTPNEIQGATLYDCNKDQDLITHSHPDDAIDSYVDSYDPDEPIEEGECVTLYGFAPNEKPSADEVIKWSAPLDALLASLDEDHELGGDDPQEVTDNLRAAERVFVEKVLAAYRVRRCEVVGHKEIDLRAWCKENRPDALSTKETD